MVSSMGQVPIIVQTLSSRQQNHVGRGWWYYLAKDAITNDHKLTGLNNRNILSPTFGGQARSLKLRGQHG